MSSATLIQWTNDPSRAIARAARVSTAKDDPESAADCRAFVKRLMDWGHWTPFEFVSLTFKVTCTRAVSHELVRHRHMSFVQESQRYVRYSKDDFSFQLPDDVFDEPKSEVFKVYVEAFLSAKQAYLALLDMGEPPEDARLVLPNATKTNLMVNTNLREFRHFLDLRTASAAWEPMRGLALQMADCFCNQFPDDRYLVEDVLHG